LHIPLLRDRPREGGRRAWLGEETADVGKWSARRRRGVERVPPEEEARRRGQTTRMGREGRMVERARRCGGNRGGERRRMDKEERRLTSGSHGGLLV
jgi:hypothetical protein